MAQGRFLSRTTATSKQLDAISWRAELLFLRCIPHLDRDGRMDGDPVMVKSTAAPRSPKLPAGMIPALLAELEEAGLIVRYSVGDDHVIWFPKFRDHQQGMKYERERPSRFPPPELRRKSGGDPEEVRSSAGAGPDQLRPKRSSSLSLSGSSRPKRSEAASSNDHLDEVSSNSTTAHPPETEAEFEARKQATKAALLAARTPAEASS